MLCCLAGDSQPQRVTLHVAPEVGPTYRRTDREIFSLRSIRRWWHTNSGIQNYDSLSRDVFVTVEARPPHYPYVQTISGSGGGNTLLLLPWCCVQAERITHAPPCPAPHLHIVCDTHHPAPILLFRLLHRMAADLTDADASCEAEDCTVKPNYGFEGGVARFCAIHKEEGMQNLSRGRCKVRVRSFGVRPSGNNMLATQKDMH